jgi:hypothetical protein
LVTFFSFLITVSKLLVTSGWNSDGEQTTSEIVDLTVKGGNMCNNWPDLVRLGSFSATGGIIENTIMICGGLGGGSYFDECYSLTSEKATLVTHMSVRRSNAASIVLNDNTLWITGGYGHGLGTGRLASTEYVTVTGTILGPDLPMTLEYHAMVAINSSCSMVIGGYSDWELGIGYYDDYYHASTFFYDHNEKEWINGPSLMQARRQHAARIVTDEVTEEQVIAVTGGSYYSNAWFYLDSSEILQDGVWVQGEINMLCFRIFLVTMYIYDLVLFTEFCLFIM